MYAQTYFGIFEPSMVCDLIQWTRFIFCKVIFFIRPNRASILLPYRFADVKYFLKKRNRYLVRFLCGHSADIARTLRGHFPWIFPRLSFDAVHYSPNLHDFSRLPSRQIRVIVRLQYYGFPEPFRVRHFPSRHFEAFSHPLVLPILYGFLELVNPVSPFRPPCRQFVLDPNALRFDNMDKSGQKHRYNVHRVVYYGERYPLRCLCYALHGVIF